MRPQAARMGRRTYLHAAAEYSKDRQDVGDWALDSRVTLSPYVRKKLLSGGRYLFENVGMVRGAIKDIASYSVGSAFTPSPAIMDPVVQREYVQYFENWAKAADVTNRLDFRSLLKMISVAIDRDGDIGLIFSTTATGWPKLRVVESHNIGNRYGDTDAQDGVILDRYGRARAYRVFTAADKTRDYKSDNMVLIYEADRADEVRGKTSLAHAINDLMDRQEILDAEKLAVKINSKIGMVITSQDAGEAAFFGEQTESTSGSTSLTYEKISDGAIPRLFPGEELRSFDHSRPSNTFSGFLENLIRNVAAGLGMPFEFCWDSSKLNGTGNRVILEKVDRRLQERQQTLVRVANRIWSFVVGQGYVRGELPAVEGWNQVTWQMPKRISIDPGRDGKQALEMIKFGLQSSEGYAAEIGKDILKVEDEKYNEAQRLIAAADELASETGKPFEFCLGLLRQMTANGNAGLMPQEPQGI